MSLSLHQLTATVVPGSAIGCKDHDDAIGPVIGQRYLRTYSFIAILIMPMCTTNSLQERMCVYRQSREHVKSTDCYGLICVQTVAAPASACQVIALRCVLRCQDQVQTAATLLFATEPADDDIEELCFSVRGLQRSLENARLLARTSL